MGNIEVKLDVKEENGKKKIYYDIYNNPPNWGYMETTVEYIRWEKERIEELEKEKQRNIREPNSITRPDIKPHQSHHLIKPVSGDEFFKYGKLWDSTLEELEKMFEKPSYKKKDLAYRGEKYKVVKC